MGGNDGSVYIMKEVIVNGYSTGYSGSLYQFDSYKKFSRGGDDDEGSNDIDDEYGTHSDNNGQSQGDNIGAGHPGGSSNLSLSQYVTYYVDTALVNTFYKLPGLIKELLRQRRLRIILDEEYSRNDMAHNSYNATENKIILSTNSFIKLWRECVHVVQDAM